MSRMPRSFPGSHEPSCGLTIFGTLEHGQSQTDFDNVMVHPALMAHSMDDHLSR